jgi:hypothetical protein
VAIAAAAKVCRKVTLTASSASGTTASSGTTGSRSTSTSTSTSTLYDCQGRAAQLLSTQQSPT